MCPRLAVSVRSVTFVFVYLRESRNYVLSIINKKPHDLSYNFASEGSSNYENFQNFTRTY